MLCGNCLTRCGCDAAGYLALSKTKTWASLAHLANASAPPTRPHLAATDAVCRSTDRPDSARAHPALHAGKTGKTRSRNGSHLTTLGGSDAGPASTERPGTATLTSVTVVAGIAGGIAGQSAHIGKTAHTGAGSNAETSPSYPGLRSTGCTAGAEAPALITNLSLVLRRTRPGRQARGNSWG